MRSTVDVLDESIRATDQQKEAAEQVAVAMVEIRTAAEQLASEQHRAHGRGRAVDGLVEELEREARRARRGRCKRIGCGGRQRW